MMTEPIDMRDTPILHRIQKLVGCPDCYDSTAIYLAMTFEEGERSVSCLYKGNDATKAERMGRQTLVTFGLSRWAPMTVCRIASDSDLRRLAAAGVIALNE